MSQIQWTDKLSVDIQEIDLQHRHLIGLIAELEKALSVGADKEILGKVIRDLNTYVREHFTVEERWMKRHSFPGLGDHMTQHEAFVEKLLHVELDYLADRTELSADLLDYLMLWIEEHVTGYDQRYAEYFRAKGII
jgi:hemerythrin